MTPIVGLLIRALVLLAAAWLTVTVLRRRSASLRALVWTAALGGILVLPAMASVAPRLDVPVWRAEAPQVLGGRTFRSGEVAGSKEPASKATGRLVVNDPASPPDWKVQPPTTVAAEPAGSKDPASKERRTPISWGQMALLTWGLVSLVLIARIGLSHFSLSRLAHSKDAASDARDMAWTPLVDETRTALGIRRQVRVRTTDEIGVPAVAGLIRPILLLPAEADDWHDEVKRAVVLHELAHVARWDAVGQLVSQLACAVYWCVPLAWHGARRAAILREQASDDVVLMSGMRASSYAANLLNVARMSGNASLEPATLAMAHPRRIRERIVAILDPSSARAGLRTRSLATVSITALAVVVLVATVQLTTQAAPLPAPPDGVLAPLALRGLSTNRPTVRSESPRIESVVPAPAIASEPATVSEPVPVPVPMPLPLPLPQAASLRGCERDLKETSQSTNSDGRNKVWTVRISGPDCKIDLRVDGDVEFNDTFTDVRSLSRGGAFKLDVTENGVRREIDLQERGGSLNRIYRVDGRERSYDNDAQTWFAHFLVTLDRRTAVGVDHRLPVLLRQGGVAAVLKETALMFSDYARSRYYEKMMETRQLNDGERAQVLRQAAAMTKSDYYASTVLAQVSKGGYANNELRAAALAMLDGMDSDYYRSVSVASIVGRDRPTPDDMDVLVRTVERIKSDHYKLEVLNRVVSAPLQAQHRASLARAARTIESDYYASEFLKTLAKSGVDDGDRTVFFEVISTIESDHYALEALKSVVSQARLTRAEFSSSLKTLAGMKSDHYRNETIKAVLTSAAISEADLLELVTVVAATGGDYYKGEALQAIVRHRASTDRVRSAVVSASDRLSAHYREQVRRAAGRN